MKKRKYNKRKNNKIDMVNNPPHYTQGGIEVIDFMKAKLSPEELKGYLKGQVIKYLSRGPLKGAEVEDYAKAEWYLYYLVHGKQK